MGTIMKNNINYSGGGGSGASTAAAVSYNNTASGLTSGNAQGAIDELAEDLANKADVSALDNKADVSALDNKADVSALDGKADRLTYNESSSTLLLQSGGVTLSSVHIEGGSIATIIHVQTHEESWWNNPAVTIEVKNSIEDIDNGHFDENGDYYCKIHYLDTYTIIVTDEDGAKYTKTFEDTQLGAVYYVFVDKYKNFAFHIDGSNSDPTSSVTYPIGCDNENYTPAAMNFSSGVFNYGSWENAFFMPKPCLLAKDGVVFKYLNPNDYTKDIDGNDVTTYLNGTTGTYNAMMEWGKDGKRIYYKVVPDNGDSSTSATVYISNGQLDEDYKCYSFYAQDGTLKDHFYTPIYNGTVVNGTLRSISGKAVIQSQTATVEMNCAKANGDGWCTETLADRILINFLLILIGKSLDTQSVFGAGNINGYQNNANVNYGINNTGTMNTKGLFWGNQDNKSGVKVFGMENYWGNQYRRIAGWINDKGTQKIKLTYDVSDGSTSNGYNETGTGYISIGATPNGTPGGYTNVMTFNQFGAFNTTASGSATTYYCDGFWFNNSQVNYAFVGGFCRASSLTGAFCSYLGEDASFNYFNTGAAVSYR